MADIVLDDLTDGSLTGNGVFDKLMAAVELHLEDQSSKSRINKTDFAKVYLGALDVTLQQAIQFLLQEQQADKQADLIAAQTSKVTTDELLVTAQIAKVNSEKALVDQQLANAIIEGANLTKVGTKLDAETALINAQKLKVDADELLADAQTANVNADTTNKTKEGLKLDAETSFLTQRESNAVIEATVLTAQELKVDAETALLSQKKFTEEAQIKDTVDGNTVVGVIGKQKDLYTAQKDGFARDAEQKLAKIVTDAWSVRSSVDPDTMTSPSGIADADVTAIVNQAKTGIGL